MKRAFIYLFTAFVFITNQASSQIIVDLRTGVDSNGNLLPVNSAQWPMNSADDDWYQLPPVPYAYFIPVGVGSGQRFGWSTYNWNSYSHSPNVRWLSWFITSNGEHDKYIEPGTYYYRLIFSLPSCKTLSATLNLKHFLADSVFEELSINGHTIIAPGIPYYNGTASYNIPGNYLHQGQDTVMVRVTSNSSWNGWEFDANLVIWPCAYTKVKLRDQNGIEKSDFCIDEDIFYDIEGALPNNYTLSLFREKGSDYEHMETTTLKRYPAGITLKNAFGTLNSQMIISNVNYQVRINYISDCGPQVITKTFRFICCDNSPDASFSLSKKGNVLYGKSIGTGFHTWTVYNISPQDEGAMPDSTSFGTQSLMFPTEEWKPCYLVKHTISNACGTSCASQRVCNYPCEDKECNLSAPNSLVYDPTTYTFSWSPPVGAPPSSYILEVIKNGCCASESASVTDVSTISVNGTSQVLNLLNGDEPSVVHCYLIKVYAICPDGNRSMPSNTICIQW